MVEFYCLQIQMGNISVQEVPVKFRDAVTAKINAQLDLKKDENE